MEKEEEKQKPAVSEPPKNLPLEDKGLKALNEKFLRENTEKIQQEEKAKKLK